MDKAQQNVAHRDNEEGNLVELLFCKSESCPDCFVDEDDKNGSYVFIVLTSHDSSAPVCVVCWRHHHETQKCILSFLYVSSIQLFPSKMCTNYQKKIARSPFRVMASNEAHSKLMINYCHIQTTTC
jgi:hypothetical protein